MLKRRWMLIIIFKIQTMKSALIIGGASGIGLAVAIKLAQKCDKVTIADRNVPTQTLPTNIEYIEQNLLLTDFQWLENYNNIDILFHSAGFGRVAPFEELRDKEIDNSFVVNCISVFKVLHYFMPKLKSPNPFYCGVMVSIAARIASPLFSVYSATKAALFRGIEAINTELSVSGSKNRILEVSPGSIKGTSFNGGSTDLMLTFDLAQQIISAMTNHDTLLIPEYDSVFKGVLERYNNNPQLFAEESYNFKIQGNRICNRPQLTVGYLSGTFDLFHVGHLNLLKRARQYCDYLVVGVHKDASHKGKETYIPFDERKEIVRNIRYVDEVIESEREDSDVWTKNIVKYDMLFVGSDYKGTERFNRYEKYFADKGVKIIYFPYTQGTSSTQLRDALSK